MKASNWKQNPQMPEKDVYVSVNNLWGVNGVRIEMQSGDQSLIVDMTAFEAMSLAAQLIDSAKDVAEAHVEKLSDQLERGY